MEFVVNIDLRSKIIVGIYTIHILVILIHISYSLRKRVSRHWILSVTHKYNRKFLFPFDFDQGDTSGAFEFAVRRQRFFANLCKLTTRGCSVTPALQPRGGSAAAAGKFEGTLKYKHRNRCSVWPPKPDCIITSQKYLTYFLYRVSFNNFKTQVLH